jgi:hypothetical protein
VDVSGSQTRIFTANALDQLDDAVAMIFAETDMRGLLCGGYVRHCGRTAAVVKKRLIEHGSGT